MYLCAKGTECASSYDFSMGLRKCSDSVALFVFLLNFGTVPTLCHYLFLYWILELFRQRSIICFSIGLWNWSDSVALSVYLLYFGTDQTVWHDWFFDGTLELYWQCAIICFSILLWNSSDSVSIICFSMGLWNYSHSVALSVYLLDFGTDQKVWHYLFFYGTLELFRQCNTFLVFYVTLELFRQYGIICFSIGLWICSDTVALFVSLLNFGTVPTV